MEKPTRTLFTKGERTKGAIIDAAIELFFEKGFHMTTFQMIADAVEITQPGIYTYFADKESLLVACCMKAAASGRYYIDKGIDQKSSAATRLENYVRGNLAWALEFPEQAYCLLAMSYFGINSRPLQNLHRQIDKIGFERIEIQLLQGAREGFWGETDLAQKARTIHNLLTGEIAKALHSPVELSLPKRVKQTWEMAALLLGN